MRRKSSTSLIALVVLLLALVPSRLARADNSMWGANYFPNVELVTQDGKQVRFYDDLLRGKTVIINFVYTRCGDSCPLETAKLAQVYRLLSGRMGKDIFFYSISIDSKHDKPAVLKEYAGRFHVGPGWYFLTGRKEDIDLIRKKIGMASRPDADPFTGHSTALTIGNEATGQWFVDSSLDDPRYIATIAGDWLSSWKHARPVKSYAQRPAVPPAEFERGGALFRTSCAACHTIGQGDGIGPDLAHITGQRERAWLKSFITGPDKALKRRDPIAVALFKKYNQVKMPNLRLSEIDAENLISFIEARSNELHDTPAGGKPEQQAAAATGGQTR